MTGRELQTEWAGWWRGLSGWARVCPLGLALAYGGSHAALRKLRGDHLALAAAGLAVYYAGPRLRAAGRFLLPLLIMAVVYDAQRYWAGGWRGRVRVAEPHAWELAWFGVATETGRATPAEWWQAHTHTVLDALTGAAYLLFIPVFMGCAAWWRFREKRAEGEQVMWAMLFLNLAAYATYLVYPAAPPWYVTSYGLGEAVLSALPEAGGAARFDALFHVRWFADYYGKNANVFGAIPSLHVGQTFLAVLYAWQFRSLRTLVTGFWATVVFGSVYLNHHYLVDGVVGMVFAAGAWAMMGAWVRRQTLKV